MAAQDKRYRSVLLAVETWADYSRAIIRGVLDYARTEARWEVIHPIRPPITVDVLKRYRMDVDGVIAEVYDAPTQAWLARCGLPVVWAIMGPANSAQPVVSFDLDAAYRQALAHLREAGFRQVAFCGDNRDTVTASRRMAFCQCAQAAGLPYHLAPETLTSDDLARWRTGLTKWLRSLPKPIGVVGPTTASARSVARACRRASITVPEQVAIVSLTENDLQCELCEPPLSGVDLGSFEIGREAAILLDQLMSGRKPAANKIVVEPQGVIARRSTDVLVVEDENVAQALRLIRQGACNRVTAGGVAARVPISRSALERAFRRTMGRTMQDEIMRIRIEEAKRLLASTDQDLIQISANCGFAYRTHLSNAFKAATGVTPRQYRKRHRPRALRGRGAL